MPRTLSVELRSHPGCPLVEHARALLRECLAQTGVTATITEQIGAYPSPTVIIEGVDVVGDPALDCGVTACRINTPTHTKLTAALLEASCDIR